MRCDLAIVFFHTPTLYSKSIAASHWPNYNNVDGWHQRLHQPPGQYQIGVHLQIVIRTIHITKMNLSV